MVLFFFCILAENDIMELLIHIVLELAALFALFWTLRTKKIFPGIISILMIAGIILVLYPDIQNNFYGLFVYMAACILAMIYGFLQLKSNKLSAYLIIIMSASMFIHWLWLTNHWHGNTLIFTFITLIAGGVALISRTRMKYELGFLIILAADAVSVIIENLLK